MKKRYLLLFFYSVFSFVLYAGRVGSDLNVARQQKVFFAQNDTNELAGFSIFKNGFMLQNSSASATFNSYFPLSGDIVLNGGTLTLGADLVLQNPVTLSPGTIDSQFFSIMLPHNGQKVYLPTLKHERTLINVLEQTFSRRVYALDWSYDNKYLALGFDASSGIHELQIYEFLTDQTLSLKASFNFSSNSDDVRVLSWHPSSYYLATGSLSGNELRTFLFDPGTPSVTEIDNVNQNDVLSLAWSPDGNYLAVGKSSTSVLYVYPVTNGSLGTAVQSSLSASTRVYDLDWKSTGDYIVVGLRSTSGTAEIKVFSFNGTTLTLNAQQEMSTNVYTCKWRPNSSIFSAGLSARSEQLKTYEFSPGSITELTSARVNETKAVFDLEWSPDGSFLATTKDSDSNGFEVELFCYDATNKELHMVTGYDLGVDGLRLAWSPNGEYLAVSGTNNKLWIFHFYYQPIIFKDTKIISPSELVVTGPIKFEGNCNINAYGNIIDMTTTGSFIVTQNAQLTIQDAVIKGIHGDTIHCTHDSSSLVLEDVLWLQDGATRFDKGSLYFNHSVKMKGNYVFGYHSTQTFTLAADSKLYLSNGFTFSYDPANSYSKDLFVFEDSSSQLILDRSTLYTTTVGMNLMKGTMIVANDATIASEKVILDLVDDDQLLIDNGITFGDSLSLLNDFDLLIMAGVKLTCSSGSLEFKNVNSQALRMFNTISSLQMNSNTMIKIREMVELPIGNVIFQNNAVLAQSVGAQLMGSIVPLGRLPRTKLS